MSNPTENPIPSQQDDIKSVLQDVLFQQVDTLLKFTRTDGFTLQIPETETLILAGPLTRIAEFIQREIAAPAASLMLSDQTPFADLRTELARRCCAQREDKIADAAIASQSQAAQPTGWQSMESAPKDGREVLLYLREPYSRIAKAFWHAPWENWQEGEVPHDHDEYGGIGSACPTHWMPLPEAPAAHIAGTSQATQQPTADLADDDRYQHVRDILLDAMGAADVVNKSRLNMVLDLLSDIAVAPKCAARPSQATRAQAEPKYTIAESHAHGATMYELGYQNGRASVAKEAPAVLEGWKLVPVEPTPEMLEESRGWLPVGARHHGLNVYRAMLATAPVSPEGVTE